MDPEELARLQRLAGLGTMSAALAHEFNNLLTPIVSYCQYAAKQNDPAVLRSAVERAAKNASRLTNLCSTIMNLAAGTNAETCAVAVRPLLNEALECLGRDLAKDKITVTIDASEELRVLAHADSLRQVLFNLLINARQAMLERGGRLTLTAQRVNQQVEITIADTGRGIAPENLERIFEPFFSTKREEPSTERTSVGLGLYVCRRLMMQQDGSIVASSIPGQGATFTLTLPAANETGENSAH